MELYKEIMEYAVPALVGLYAIIRIALYSLKAKAKHKKDKHTITDITKMVIDAEKMLGKAQGTAKLQYVQTKLNDKTKKTTNKINDTVEVINTIKELTAEKEKKTKEQE